MTRTDIELKGSFMNSQTHSEDIQGTSDSTTTSVSLRRGRWSIGSRSGESSSQQVPAGRSSRRNRRVGVLAGAALMAIMATGCFPTGPVETWVPDFNGDGAISSNEVEAQKQAIVSEYVAAVEAQQRAVQKHPFLVCVRRHESDRGGYPHINGYAAQNPRSTASGAYQFLSSSWRTFSARAGHPGYATAAQAPWHVQDAVALYTLNSGWRSAWNGSGC
jgi:muramidase (phage lysozyme)